MPVLTHRWSPRRRREDTRSGSTGVSGHPPGTGPTGDKCAFCDLERNSPAVRILHRDIHGERNAVCHGNKIADYLGSLRRSLTRSLMLIDEGALRLCRAPARSSSQVMGLRYCDASAVMTSSSAVSDLRPHVGGAR